MNKRTLIEKVLPSTKRLRMVIKPILKKHGVTVVSSRTKRGPQWSYTYTMPPAIGEVKWDSKFRTIDYVVEADEDKIDAAIKSIEMLIALMGAPYQPLKSLNFWYKDNKRTYSFYAYMEN